MVLERYLLSLDLGIVQYISSLCLGAGRKRRYSHFFFLTKSGHWEKNVRFVNQETEKKKIKSAEINTDFSKKELSLLDDLLFSYQKTRSFFDLIIIKFQPTKKLNKR